MALELAANNCMALAIVGLLTVYLMGLATLSGMLIELYESESN